jgi:hypothetical protein
VIERLLENETPRCLRNGATVTTDELRDQLGQAVQVVSRDKPTPAPGPSICVLRAVDDQHTSLPRAAPLWRHAH